MHENPTNAYNFLEEVLAMGGLNPSFLGLLQADCRKIKFMVGDVGGKTPPQGEDPLEEIEGSLLAKNSSNEEPDDLEIRFTRKQKVSPKAGSKAVIPESRSIRSRLRSASSQKPFPVSKVASKVPSTGVKRSLSKNLKTSSLVSEPLLVSLPSPTLLSLFCCFM
ncbi:hypothetical protein Hanom_Chr05g00429061 [Helianthus anomalus]